MDRLDGHALGSAFDSSLGTLTGATIELVATLTGEAAGENRDLMNPATVRLDLSTALSASGPGGLSLSATPAATRSFNATAFDGAADFLGTSGATFTAISSTESGTLSVTDPAGLALLTGLGSLDWSVTADGSAVGSGSGNLATWFSTSAAATLSVTYTYDPSPVVATPIPAPAALLLGGLVALGVVRRRRA